MVISEKTVPFCYNKKTCDSQTNMQIGHLIGPVQHNYISDVMINQSNALKNVRDN